MDAKWVPIHWLELHPGGTTRSTLTGLTKF